MPKQHFFKWGKYYGYLKNKIVNVGKDDGARVSAETEGSYTASTPRN